MIVLFAQFALTPAGKPFAPETPLFEIPVAPVVVCIITVNAVLIHKVGELEAAPAVLFGFTVTVVVAQVVLLQTPFILVA